MTVSHRLFQRFKLHAVQSRLSVDEACMKRLFQKRPVAAGIDCHIQPHMLTHVKGIVHILFQGLVPGHHGDGTQVDLLAFQCHEDGHRVIMARIAVQKDGLFLRHRGSPFFPTDG